MILQHVNNAFSAIIIIIIIIFIITIIIIIIIQGFIQDFSLGEGEGIMSSRKKSLST